MAVALTTYEIMDERAKMLGVLLDVFVETGTRHCLIGGLAVGYHGRPRATVDVDFLVSKRHIARVARALEARGYVVTRHEGMMRVYAPGATPGRDEAIADLVAWEANPTLRAAARASEPAEVLGHPVQIVQRGALVALKFHAAVSPARRIEDRYIDVGDIGRVMRAGFDDDDRALALRIAETMYPGAPEQLAQLLDDLRHNRPVKI